jgi:hypothetical protein
MGMVATDEIPHTRIGERNLRFPVDALREWAAQRTTWPITVNIPPEEEQQQ